MFRNAMVDPPLRCRRFSWHRTRQIASGSPENGGKHPPARMRTEQRVSIIRTVYGLAFEQPLVRSPSRTGSSHAARAINEGCGNDQTSRRLLRELGAISAGRWEIFPRPDQPWLLHAYQFCVWPDRLRHMERRPVANANRIAALYR